MGAGTAGTIVANRMRSQLPEDWQIQIVDPAVSHLYQPGLLFLPFGPRDEYRILRRREHTFLPGVHWYQQEVIAVDSENRTVVLADRERLDYDLLVIASGSRIRPERTAGLSGAHYGDTAHDFYTLDGARHLQSALQTFVGGRLVVNIMDLPIKSPVAPLEFLFLADAFFTHRGCREEVELVYATPLDSISNEQATSRCLDAVLNEKGIRVESGFRTDRVDGRHRTIDSHDAREIAYDLLVTVPAHSGASFLDGSDLGNEQAFVPTDPKTLLAAGHDDIFVLGDATDLPIPKIGSVAHFQSELLVENLTRTIRGESLLESFDGHASCFVETGFGKAMLLDSSYEVEPLPGQFPLPWVGPLTLLEESRRNHWGKLAFRWLYWHAILPGHPSPISSQMSMAGKKMGDSTTESEQPN